MAYDEAPFPVFLVNQMIIRITGLIDDPEIKAPSVTMVNREVLNGNLFVMLDDIAGGPGLFDNSMFNMYPGFMSWYKDQIENHCKVMDGNERRKYGIEYNGLCMLVAYSAGIVTQGDNLTLGSIW